MNEVLRGEDAPKDKKKESFHKIQLGNSKFEGKPTSCFSPLCEEKERRK